MAFTTLQDYFGDIDVSKTNFTKIHEITKDELLKRYLKQETLNMYDSKTIPSVFNYDEEYAKWKLEDENKEMKLKLKELKRKLL